MSFCDKKFSEPYSTKRHINLEHKNKKLKCEKCIKSFQCKESLSYHELTNHAIIAPSSHCCEICEKTFLTKVGLRNHMKFTHTNVGEKIQCDQCKAKFKHKKYFNAHMLNVHGLDQKKEDYWQDIPKRFFECNDYKSKFARKSDLTVHIKSKHKTQDRIKCDQCSAEFKYSKNLNRHKLEKHMAQKYKCKCPDCGKVFKQKRNMKRHQLSHIKNHN